MKQHVFDAAGAAAAPVRGHSGPGDVRPPAADRDDLGVARGSRGVEELRRVALDDASSEGGQVELVEPGLIDGGIRGGLVGLTGWARLNECNLPSNALKSRARAMDSDHAFGVLDLLDVDQIGYWLRAPECGTRAIRMDGDSTPPRPAEYWAPVRRLCGVRWAPLAVRGCTGKECFWRISTAFCTQN